MLRTASFAGANPVAADQDDHDEHKPDPELPILRRQRRDPILQELVDHRADQAAIEIAGAADDQHEKEIGGAIQREHVERAERGGLGEQRAGDAGKTRRDRIDRDQTPFHRNADRRRAQRIAFDRAQRQAERRIDDAAHDDEADEQHDQAIDVAVVAVEIETEQAEDRRHGDALQPVGAASEIGVAVGDFVEHQRDAERDHEARQVGAAQHQKARDEAERGRDQAAEDQRDDRLVDDAVFGDQAGEISGDAEKRRLAQRQDAGIAEDEVERQREQRQDRRVLHDQIFAGEQPDGGESENPERDLERRPAGALLEISGDVVGERDHRAHRAVLRANRPCGRQSKTTIMIA